MQSNVSTLSKAIDATHTRAWEHTKAWEHQRATAFPRVIYTETDVLKADQMIADGGKVDVQHTYDEGSQLLVKYEGVTYFVIDPEDGALTMPIQKICTVLRHLGVRQYSVTDLSI